MHPATRTQIAAEPADSAAALEAANLESLYHFAYGLSHEINNPLANIASRAQALLADEKDAERRRKLATIVQQAFRAHEMIADLMLFARPPVPTFGEVDLVKLADTVVKELQPQADAQGTKLLRASGPLPLRAVVDATQISVALKALVQNSLEAVASGGQVTVGLSDDLRFQISDCRMDAGHASIPSPHPSDADSNQKSAILDLKFAIIVTDTGPGIPPEIRPHIFDPFFSGREAGRGLGLGLAKAWRIAELHGGQILVDSALGQGTTFRIVLPSRG